MGKQFPRHSPLCYSSNFLLLSVQEGLYLTVTCTMGMAQVLFLVIFFGFWRRNLDKGQIFSPPSVSIASEFAPRPVLFLYVTCNAGKSRTNTHFFNASGLPGPSRELPCSLDTNLLDCREGVPMLNFMIETYDHPLAERYVFLHGHENAWHYKPGIFQQMEQLMQTDYFWNEEFGGLYKRFYTVGPQWFEKWAWPIYAYVFANTTMGPDTANKRPEKNHHPCCASFFTKTSLLHKRPKSDYIRIRDRLRDWSRLHPHWRRGAAHYCGTVMEWSWHLLLANKTKIPVPPI